MSFIVNGMVFIVGLFGHREVLKMPGMFLGKPLPLGRLQNRSS